MTIPDVNAVVRKYLVTASAETNALIALVGTKIFVPRLPENTELPAVSLFVRGGRSTPYVPDLVSPSFQVDSWADDPIEARAVYRALYSALQGIQNIKVTIAPTDYYIMSAIEEVQGQDLVDEIPGYFRVLSFFSIMVR
jgi:hypothetical protein